GHFSNGVSGLKDNTFLPIFSLDYNRSVEVFVARTANEIEHAAERLCRAEALGCDTETSGLSAKYGRLFSIQFSDGEFNLLVPLSEGVSMGPFVDVLADERVVKIFHNAKFDLE